MKEYNFEPIGDLIHHPESRIYIDHDSLYILGENERIPKTNIRTEQGIIRTVLDLTELGRVESRIVHDFVREAMFIRRFEG
ncbi:MAG: hypothetical protein ABR542_09065 [Desulfonatronovibrio sp.]